MALPPSEQAMIETHEVINQSVLPPNEDVYARDTSLVETVQRYGGGWANDTLSSLGTLAGSQEVAALNREANRNKPVLVTHDRFGNRVDEVTFHPAYHQLMRIGKEHGVHSFSWKHAKKPGAFVARAALHYLYCQVEAGVCCPMTMTHAVVPSLETTPELAAEWKPRILTNAYDQRMVPAAQKSGVTFGMAMTEKQGGTDVRANSTVAKPIDGAFELWGHKWFCSAPMSDAFLTLAQGPEGLSCYLVPRFRPDGSRNHFHLQRLKDKLGNHSNASSEVEYRGTWAQAVGVPGRGVPTIIEMVAQTRMDVATGAAGLMRHAVRLAIHHAQHRSTFGKKLIDHPLMRNVLADLALETEAATALSFSVVDAYGKGEDDHSARAYARGAMAIAKYWCAKRLIGVTAEALECHGGNGYVEDFPLAQMYREAPLGSIWEGSGNVQCLDVLRTMQRSPAAFDAVRSSLMSHRGKDSRLDRCLGRIERTLGDPESVELRARSLVEQMALALQAGLLLEATPRVGEAFLQARLGDGGLAYGNLESKQHVDLLLSRA